MSKTPKKKATKAKPKKKALELKNPPDTKTSPTPGNPAGETLTRRDVERQIHVPVDSGLLPELNMQLVDLLDREERLILSRAEAVAGIRKEIKEVVAQRKELVVKLKLGETITVVCEEIKDFEAQIVKYVRKDTKEEVERREMTPEDHQLTLNTEEANAATHEDGADDGDEDDSKLDESVEGSFLDN